MPLIPFTQYLRPHGKKTLITIDRPQSVYDKAMKIIEAGYVFEAEVLTTGMVSLTIGGKHTDVCMELVMNNEAVPAAVDKMINGFNFTLAANLDRLRG